MEEVKVTRNVNKAVIIGELVQEINPSHIFSDKIFYFVKLKINQSKSDKFDIVQVFVPGDMIFIEGVIPEVGTILEIEGRLIFSKLQDVKDISIVATKFSKATADSEHRNEVYLSGSIYKSYDIVSYDSKKFYKNLVIHHNDEIEPNKYINAKVTCWNSLAKLADTYEVDDHIIIKGRLVSKNQDFGGGRIFSIHKILAIIISNGSELDE